VRPQPAVHRAIVLIDVEGFSRHERTNAHQAQVRADLYDSIEQAFADAGISWNGCYHEDRGDGILVLVPPEVVKSLLVESLPWSLVKELRRRNALRPSAARLRVRLALHAGEVVFDTRGVTGTALTTAFRLLEAPPLKQSLAESPGVLALITSPWFYEEVVRHSPASEPSSFHQVTVAVKETTTTAWISLPDNPYARNSAGTTVELPHGLKIVLDT
jgi:class 3 adenylate cyclase